MYKFSLDEKDDCCECCTCQITERFACELLGGKCFVWVEAVVRHKRCLAWACTGCVVVCTFLVREVLHLQQREVPDVGNDSNRQLQTHAAHRARIGPCKRRRVRCQGCTLLHTEFGPLGRLYAAHLSCVNRNWSYVSFLWFLRLTT